MQLKILRLIKEFSCIYSGICFPRRVFAQRGWQVDVPIWAWTKQTVWFHEKLTTSESTNPWVDSVHNVSKNMLLCESEGSAYSNKSCPHLFSDFFKFLWWRSKIKIYSLITEKNCRVIKLLTIFRNFQHAFFLRSFASVSAKQLTYPSWIMQAGPFGT